MFFMVTADPGGPGWPFNGWLFSIRQKHGVSIVYNSVLCDFNEHNADGQCCNLLIHKHSPDGDRHPSTLLCKLLQ